MIQQFKMKYSNNKLTISRLTSQKWKQNGFQKFLFNFVCFFALKIFFFYVPIELERGRRDKWPQLTEIQNDMSTAADDSVIVYFWGHWYRNIHHIFLLMKQILLVMKCFIQTIFHNAETNRGSINIIYEYSEIRYTRGRN